MYISYYKYPVLQMFDPDACTTFTERLKNIFGYFNPANPDFRIYKGDELQQIDDKQKMLSITNVAAHFNTDVSLGKYADGRFKIYMVSPTFFNAMQKSYDKLRPVMDEDNALRSVFEDAVFIIGERVMIFMHLNDNNFRYMEFRGEHLVHFSDFSIKDDEFGLAKYKDMDTITVANFAGYENIWTPDLILYQQSFILFFKKYGNIDLEMLPAKKLTRRSNLLGQKVNNFMGIDVQVLDSRWFTTICRDEGFLVSGHFRLQPCKDEHGEWTRKLIYINPYAKHGYHRMASIVNLNADPQ